MKRARICFLLALTLVFVLGFGSTALATSSYTLSATGEGEVQTIYNWTIDKSAVPQGDLNLSVGESQVVDYTINVNKEEETGFLITVSGTLSMIVNAENGLDVDSVTAKFYKYSTLINEETLESDPHYDPSSTAYTFDYDYDTTDSLGYGNYTIVFNVYSSNHRDRDTSTSVSFTLVDVNKEVTVSDAVTSGLPADVAAAPDAAYLGTWPNISTSTPITYSVEFTNNGNKSGNSWPYDNTATIQETGQQDSATVTVSVPKVDSGNPPEPREERKVRWPDRTPPPEESAAPAAVELPKTGGFIEWEWIALAGGMLASGGGALYLVRRRKMKK